MNTMMINKPRNSKNLDKIGRSKLDKGIYIKKKPPILIPKKLGIFKTEKPAFLSLHKFSPNGAKSLVITSFNVFGVDSVKIVPEIGHKIDSVDKIKTKEITRNITWPNGVTAVPKDIFGTSGMLVAGGFLTPFKSNGAITFIPINTKKQIKITKKMPGWFYHRTELIDMNNNGRKDILTARTTKPGKEGESVGKLVWLENPGGIHKPWKEHVIMSGADIHFTVHDINKNGQKEIITADFFGKKLNIIWKENNSFKIKSIDNDIGFAFDVQVADINGDGKMELLATNHENPNGAVYAYEIPQNFKKDIWKRNTLLDGIKTEKNGDFEASPGQAVAFYPHKNMKKRNNIKPYILVSGDGSTKVHLLVPESNDPKNWKYKEQVILNGGSTVGQLAIGDINNDGYAEVFVPLYDKNEIHVYSFNESKVVKV